MPSFPYLWTRGPTTSLLLSDMGKGIEDNNSPGQSYPKGSETALTILARPWPRTSKIYTWKEGLSASMWMTFLFAPQTTREP